MMLLMIMAPMLQQDDFFSVTSTSSSSSSTSEFSPFLLFHSSDSSSSRMGGLRWIMVMIIVKILAKISVKFVQHNRRVQTLLLLGAKSFVTRCCRCQYTRLAVLTWLDECLLRQEVATNNNKAIPTDHHHHPCSADWFIPNSCCPKRRARWEKNWRKKKQCRDDEQRSNRRTECCFFRKIFCLPPPLPLREQDSLNKKKRTKHQGTTDEETIVHAEDSIVKEEEEEDASSASTTSKQESIQLVASNSNIPIVARNVVPAPTPQVHLIDLVRMQQWPTLLAQPKFRRRQVKYRDPDGLYPLHWAAAGGSPLPVIDRLLGAAAHIAKMADTEGSLPLHFATHYSASRDVIAAIWKAYPDAILHRDRYGRTPLYHAVDKALSLSTLQLLIHRCEETATASTITTPHYELITTPCFSPPGSTPREQATRTPLFMVWASVLNDREARINLRGKTWDKAVWMLQNSYRYHHHHLIGPNSTTAQPPKDLSSLLSSSDSSASSLVSICIRMDLYLPDPVVPLVVAQKTPHRLSDLVVAASTPSYSLARILELLHCLLSNYDDVQDDNGTAALAATRAGQPWEVLEVLPHRDRHSLAILAALATPIVYERTANAPYNPDPLGLLRRIQTPKAATTSTSSMPIHESPTIPTPYGASPTETIFRLLRENPSQLLTTAQA